QVDALPGDVVFPAVIRAAQAAVLVAAEPERHAAMRAELLHQADAAFAVAPGDERLAEELDAHRRAVGLGYITRQHRRQPVAPEKTAHQRPGPGARQRFVVLSANHSWPRMLARSAPSA